MNRVHAIVKCYYCHFIGVSFWHVGTPGNDDRNAFCIHIKSEFRGVNWITKEHVGDSEFQKRHYWKEINHLPS